MNHEVQHLTQELFNGKSTNILTEFTATFTGVPHHHHYHHLSVQRSTHCQANATGPTMKVRRTAALNKKN